jgi:hypothetical protein
MHGMEIEQVSNNISKNLNQANKFILVLAISPNSNEIHIYETSSWKRLFVLGDVSINTFPFFVY